MFGAGDYEVRAFTSDEGGTQIGEGLKIKIGGADEAEQLIESLEEQVKELQSQRNTPDPFLIEGLRQIQASAVRDARIIEGNLSLSLSPRIILPFFLFVLSTALQKENARLKAILEAVAEKEHHNISSE